ncbi:flagellar hook-basal body complex protein FliE [Pleionea sediminis]|uniref:flagellar hook-basal body complex protein FliE n=1 Tax=Pleionea sediminis TaxID=2569479 RepID=UPI001186DA8B|nr:flagellar hook-basal body complex protein FliE [Pleionea sediminis]
MIEPISAISAIGNLVETSSVTTENNVGELFIEKLSEVDETINAAESNLNALASGESISTHELMLSMEKAKMQLGMIVEVRNKLVEAYQEITRIQI